MKIKKTWMDMYRQDKHGWSDEQLIILGIDPDFRKGNSTWLDSVIGKEISSDAAAKFESLGQYDHRAEQHKKNRRRKDKRQNKSDKIQLLRSAGVKWDVAAKKPKNGVRYALDNLEFAARNDGLDAEQVGEIELLRKYYLKRLMDELQPRITRPDTNSLWREGNLGKGGLK